MNDADVLHVWMYVSRKEFKRMSKTMNDADGTHARMFSSEAVASHYIRQILQVGKKKRERKKKDGKNAYSFYPS